jgi:hypothetical protein
MSYQISSANIAEDHLPPDQRVIMTSSLTMFLAYMNALTSPDNRYPIMGAVVGDAGLGKTIATGYYIDDLPLLAHTGLPSSVRARIQSGSTRKALLLAILSALYEIPRRKTQFDLADEVIDAIRRNSIVSLLIDEADRLTTDTFDLLRDIFDNTGCTIVLVGLPELQNVTKKYAKFSSRMAAPMVFEPLDKDELLETVLPAMVFPRWSFDPDNKQDLAMGGLIFRTVRSSLRELRNLLQMASHIAVVESKERITIDTIKEARQMLQVGSRAIKPKKNIDSDQPDYEGESQARRDVKEGRRGNGDE